MRSKGYVTLWVEEPHGKSHILSCLVAIDKLQIQTKFICHVTSENHAIKGLRSFMRGSS